MKDRFELEDVLLCPDKIPERVIREAKRQIKRDNFLRIDFEHPSRGYCYLCGKEVKAGPSRRYRFRIGTDKCPNCKKTVFCAIDGSSFTWDSHFIANLGTIERGSDGKTVFVREWHLKRLAENGWHGPDQLVEVARYAVRGKSIGKWTHEHRGRFFQNVYYDRFLIWQMETRKKLSVYDDGFIMVLPTKAQMKKITRGTSLQYMDIHDYEEYTKDSSLGRNDFAFMASFVRKRAFELLWKAGYKNICLSNYGYYVYNGKQSDGVAWGADSITKALGLPRYVLKVRPPASWDRQCLYNARILLPFVKQGRISHKSIEAAVFRHDAKVLEDILKATDAISGDHVLKYIKKSEWPLYMYRDYIGECVKLRLDLRDKAIAFPKDLRRAHERTMQMVKYEADKRLQAEFKKIAEKLKRFNFESDSLLIRVAASAQELEAEGKALTHCVASYSGRMAKGETAIFLIREKDAPDVPFFTLEYRSGRVIQCRTKKNVSLDSDPKVEAFVNNWLKYIKKNKLAA